MALFNASLTALSALETFIGPDPKAALEAINGSIKNLKADNLTYPM
jgi:hypothetical protein